MKAMSRALDLVVEVTTVLGGLAVMAMMMHIVADVTMRYLFSSPLPGTISVVSYYYMVIATFIPLAYAEKINAHISVEVVYELLPRWMKVLSTWIGAILTVAVISLMAAKSWQIAIDKYNLGSKVIQGNTVLPIWPGYFLVPVGLALMVLMVVAKMLRFAAAGMDHQGTEAPGND